MTSASDRAPHAIAPGSGIAELVARRPSVVEQIIRYACVSALALGLDFTVFLLLTHFSAMSPATAGATGYSLGLVLHYVLSVRFVFDADASLKTRRRLFGEFVASGLFGVFATWAVIHLATGTLGMGSVPAKGLAVIISFAAVFIIRRSIIFAARTRSR
ncbi:MAG: GtrA family protein [Hyphomicrobium sp.]